MTSGSVPSTRSENNFLLIAIVVRSWLAEIGEHDVLQRDVAHLPGGIEERAVQPYEQCRLACRVALLDDVVDAGDGGGIGARPDEQLVSTDNLVDLAHELHM